MEETIVRAIDVELEENHFTAYTTILNKCSPSEVV